MLDDGVAQRSDNGTPMKPLVAVAEDPGLGLFPAYGSVPFVRGPGT